MDEKNIPIEIALGKLMEWLESRKIVPKNWERAVQDIRLKMTDALEDMPSHADLAKMLADGTYMNYNHAVQIVGILEMTEKDTKNIFGRYGSQRINDWMAIVRLYEKDNLYLAELAHLLHRFNMEVPALRKQNNKIGQVIEESQQRIKNSLNAVAALNSTRKSMCEKLCIAGVDLRTEFMGRIRELPDIYSGISDEMSQLQDALKMYAEFACNPDLLPILRHIAVHGNSTVYEYTHKLKPEQIEEPAVRLNLTCENTNFGDCADIDIDFGDIDANDMKIDYGEINYDENIDWGLNIELTDVNAVEFEIAQGPARPETETPTESGDRVARGAQAFLILDSPLHRTIILDELYELNDFLQTRLYELRSDQSQSITFHLIDANSRHDFQTISKLSAQVQSVIKMYENEVVEHLYRLKHSATFAQTLAKQLQDQKDSVDKSSLIRELLNNKIASLKNDQNGIREEIAKTIEAAKQIQKQISNDISKRYDGRIVSIFGGIDGDSN